MSENTPIPVTFGGTPESTAERLERYGRVQALEALCKSEQDRLRDSFEDDADRIEADTGGAFNVKVPKVGQVYRTAPEPKAVVTDEAELLEWLEEEAPDLVSERRELRILDRKAAVNLVHAVQMGAQGTKAELIKGIKHAFAIDVVRGVPTDTIFEALEQYDIARVTREGDCITAEGEIVPGTGVQQADRRMTVRITEKDAFAAELRAAIPALTERNDA